MTPAPRVTQQVDGLLAHTLREEWSAPLTTLVMSWFETVPLMLIGMALFRLGLREFGAEIGSCHQIAPVQLARRFVKQVSASQSRSQGATGIAGGRLNPNLVKDSSPNDLTVRHTVERDASR